MILSDGRYLRMRLAVKGLVGRTDMAPEAKLNEVESNRVEGKEGDG